MEESALPQEDLHPVRSVKYTSVAMPPDYKEVRLIFDDEPGPKPDRKLLKREGWKIVPAVDHPGYERTKRKFRRAEVFLRGATTGACVNFAAEEALERGADTVTVELEYSTTGDSDADTLSDRAREFFKTLPAHLRNDPRLHVTPVDVSRPVRESYRSRARRRGKRY